MAKEIILTDWLMKKLPPAERFHEILRFLIVVFHTGKRTKMEMFLFFATSAAGLGINQMTMWFFVEIAGLWYMFAKVIASGIVMIWNYATKRYILKGKV